MYIHIGEDLNIRLKEIIAILDKQSGNSSLSEDEFLMRHKGKVVNLAKKSFKSMIITDQYVYLSPFASATLKKRSNFMNIQDL